jgi:hypothetical protein
MIEDKAREIAATVFAAVGPSAEEFEKALLQALGRDDLPVATRINLFYEPYLYAASTIAFQLQGCVDGRTRQRFLEVMAETVAFYLATIHLQSPCKDSQAGLYQEKVKGQFLRFFEGRMRDYRDRRGRFRTRIVSFFFDLPASPTCVSERAFDKRFLRDFLTEWMRREDVTPPAKLMEQFTEQIVRQIHEIKNDLPHVAGLR